MSYLAVGQHSPRREAAKALKARNIPAQGKHAESVRRPGYNGDYVSVPRPLRPQSASPTGAEEAMEPHFFCLLCRPSSGCLDEEDAFQGLRQRRNPWLVCRTLSACSFAKLKARFQRSSANRMAVCGRAAEKTAATAGNNE